MSEHFVTYDQVVKKRVTKKVRRMGVGVRCKDCGAMTPVRQAGDCPELAAAELWNRRAEA